MGKSKRRRAREAEKARLRAQKRAAINKPSGKSRYGRKKALQAKGVFSSRSPFEAVERVRHDDEPDQENNSVSVKEVA